MLFLFFLLLLLPSYSLKIRTSERFHQGHFPNIPGHVEVPERVESIINHFNDKGYKLDPVWERPDTLDLIKTVHHASYVEEIRELCAKGSRMISPFDQDTYIDYSSFDTCILAQNAWINCIDDVLGLDNDIKYNYSNDIETIQAMKDSKEMTSFAISRPPGHHAVKGNSMGFCIFNYAVGAANYAQSRGVKKIAMLDFDVHHGNGIASLVSHNQAIRYCSLHQMNIFPNGISSNEDWNGPVNNCLNVGVPADSTIEYYLQQLQEKALPFLNDPEFGAELLIVSAGYDALYSDPMANISLKPNDYGDIARIIRASFKAGLPMVFGLEGGYNLADLPLAVEKTVESLMECEKLDKNQLELVKEIQENERKM